ncbi:MAG: collagen-like protein, partial [Bacteroidota bacterium]
MKKLLLSFEFILITLCLLSQSPQSFKYQAVVRDATGLVITDQNVSIRISLLEGSVSGTVVYQEEHSVTSNDFGLVNLEIGNGNVVSGDFSLVPWGSDSYFIKIELDENGGT